MGDFRNHYSDNTATTSDTVVQEIPSEKKTDNRQHQRKKNSRHNH